jgi:hypothetical protein
MGLRARPEGGRDEEVGPCCDGGVGDGDAGERIGVRAGGGDVSPEVMRRTGENGEVERDRGHVLRQLETGSVRESAVINRSLEVRT